MSTHAATEDIFAGSGGEPKADRVYLAQGGVTNLRHLHAFLSDTVLMTGFGFGEPESTPSWGLLERSSDADGPTVAALSKYSSTSQSPAMVSAVNGSSDWHRGVYYYINGTTATFNFVLDGKGASECPNPFANIALSQQIKATNGNIACTYLLGPVTGY